MSKKKKRIPPCRHHVLLTDKALDRNWHEIHEWLESVDTDRLYAAYDAFFAQGKFYFARQSHAVEFKLRFG